MIRIVDLRRRVIRMLMLVALICAVVVLPAPAEAGGTCLKYKVVPLPNGGSRQVCMKYEGGGDGTTPGPGPSGPPPCDLTKGMYTEFCEGTAACWGNDPAAVQNPQELEGVPKPEKDAHVAYKSCQRPDGSTYDKWFWSTGGKPSVADRVLTARGLLNPPKFAATFNPPGHTLVNLDTWWWAQGAPTGRIVGTSAFGVVAIATPNRMVVEPGDGSPAFSCPISVTKSDTCRYTYRRSSNRGSARGPDGSRAYEARVRLVYDVRFEDNGAPMKVPGVPPEVYVMEGTDTVNVVVLEVQSEVTSVD